MNGIKKEVVILCIFLALASLNTASADVVGCCSNSGAGLLTCSTDRLVLRDKECCPTPEEDIRFQGYYKSAQNPNGPANYNDCAANFFSATGCNNVPACTSSGCCCSESGGTIKSKAECQGTGLTFHEGQTDCNQICPAPQCSGTFVGGVCIPPGGGCGDPNYAPKLSGFDIEPVKGQRKFLLGWQDECSSAAASYDVLRCKGNGCTTFAILGTTNTNSFEDSSGDLLFDEVYTYKIVANYNYNLQAANPAITKTATLGNIECMGQPSSNNFCIHEPYYSQYSIYLSANFPETFSKSFSDGVKNKFGDRLNKAFFCDAFNKLTPEGTACSSTQACVVENNEPACLNKINCNYNDANPFGLFYTLEGCENNRYCFYDRSGTIVNSCFDCSTSMACYDYKTEGACTRDNCRAGSCKWKNLASQIGIGVCISAAEYNCQWCDKRGTSTLENTRSFNEVFDFCTKEKSDALSEGSFKCYFQSEKSKNCNEVACTDYDAGQCSSTKITHDENNKITNPPADECDIKVCQNINNACVKNADGDNNADCSSAICEKDYFATNTTLLPTIKKGKVDSMLVQIYDKTSVNSQSILKTSSDYATFLCVEPCGAQGHPYSTSTTSRTIIISNLDAYDGSNGNKLFTLNEGANIIRYYSQDPSKNIGEVKKISMEAHDNTDGPKKLSVDITDGAKILDKIFTSNQNPEISVQFLDGAIVTFARLVNKKTGAIVNLQGNSQLSASVILPVGQTLPNGEYMLELNAKNKNNIFMDQPLSQAIIIDNIKPIVSISISDDATFNTSLVPITVTSNEEINIDSITINTEDIKSSFSTSDNKIFKSSINLSDGNKNLALSASDFAKNQIALSVSFVIYSSANKVKIIRPEFGVTSTPVFDIAAATNNNAVCRYSLDTNFDYDFMEPFTSSGGTTHTISGFNKISTDTNVHKLYVKCRDGKGIFSNISDISVDASPPLLKSTFAYPNPVIETPPITTLTVESDEPVVCKFSSSSRQFDSMEGKFTGFDNNTFTTINKQAVTLENEGSYVYYVACKNKAGLSSGTAEIPFKVDLSVSLEIISHTPDYFNSTNAVLAVETNKKSQCKYSETDITVQSGEIFGEPSYNHIAPLRLSAGEHTLYVSCKDQFQQKFSYVLAITFTIDITPPQMLYVNDTSTFALFPEKTCLTDRLRVKFLAEDRESGVMEYAYTLIKKVENRPIISLIKTFIGGDFFFVSNLSLEDDTDYFFRAMSANFVGLWSDFSSSNGVRVETSACKPAPACGDSNLDQGELCDPDAGDIIFGPINKCTQFPNFIGGSLGCTYTTSENSCQIDTTGCQRQPFCSDSIIQKGEHCDTSKFGSASGCTDLGFASGTLTCGPDCFLDTSKCQPKPKCGNSIIDQGEECDGSNIGPLSGQCTQYDSLFTGGTLKCKSDCKLDTSQCFGVSGACGNSILNINEKCDGAKFGIVNDCFDLGFNGGTLSCNLCSIDTSKCQPKQKCGNSIIDQGEECDGANLGFASASCASYSPYFSGGTLKCNSDCKLDTFGCSEAPLCGNGVIDGTEQCDSSNLGKLSTGCRDFSSSFIGGNIKCKSDCTVDTSACVSSNVCGNGVIEVEAQEQCDGTNFGSLTGTCINFNSAAFNGGNLTCDSQTCKIGTSRCSTKGCGDGLINAPGEECDKDTFGLIKSCMQYTNFVGGTLKCTNECKLDTSECIMVSTCGNKDIDPGEACDGTNFGAIKICTDYNGPFSGGTLKCTQACQLDTSGCTEKPKCGNSIIDQGEECDGSNIGPLSGQCTQYDSLFTGGTLKCKSDCKLDTSQCFGVSGACGNSILNINEKCDGAKFGAIKICTDYNGPFSGGTLKCTQACQLDTSGCTEKPKCSNGVIDKSESCDGLILGLASSKCTDYSTEFSAGSLKCTNDCRLDTSGCTKSLACGNGKLDTGETCDGTNFGGINDISCSKFSSSFANGTLKCTNCQVDTSACKEAPKCGNNAVESGEQCDSSNLGSKKCSDLGYISGDLSCSSSCQFDTSKCTLPPPCGNSKLDTGEVCDDTGPVYGAINSCLSFNNFIGGNLSCNKCRLDRTKCIIQPFCGDLSINKGEHCDTSKFGSASGCTDLGFASGTLTCGPDCFLDTSKCQPKPKCGNSIIDQGEECDGSNIGPLSGQCTQYDSLFTGGTLKCKSDCKLDTSQCFGVSGACGNSILNINEKCDGAKFGNITDCKDYGGFAGGIIGCTKTCDLDTTQCQPTQKCGNGLIDQGEECDGNRTGFASASCASYSPYFSGGTLKCNSDCKLDTFGCSESQKCGNGAIDSGETCDGANFGNITNILCSSYGNFINGTLSCRSCQISTANCNSNKTSIEITCRDKGDCKLNEPCSENSDCESKFCFGGKCTQPSCSDGIKNQGETQVDCGGACGKCPDGGTCNLNSDCQSGFCSFGFCKKMDTCSDGRLTPGESDIDCGGYCPTRCPAGRGCDTSADCSEGLQCASSQCKAAVSTLPKTNVSACYADELTDSDCDSMPDEWEIKNALNPNDSKDAGLDNDKEGLDNLQEYRLRTDPNSADTDKDGFTDKEEVDAKTDPLDPKSHPAIRSGVKILFFVIGAIVLVSGFGYLAYRMVAQRKKEAFEMPAQRETPGAQPREPYKHVPLSPQKRMEEAKIRESLKRKEGQKLAERKKLFEAFGKEDKEKQREELKEPKAEKQETIEVREEKKKKTTTKFPKKMPAEKRTNPKKPKEDVFARLKGISKK